MARRRHIPKIHPDAANDLRLCEWPDCDKQASHPAPSRRQMPASYMQSMEELPQERVWFCLEHVRQYNKQWDFFAEMDSDSIDRFTKDAMTGHRTTRPITLKPYIISRGYQQAAQLRNGEEYVCREAKTLPRHEREAAEILELQPPITKETLKQQYRRLVKAYHPDRHGKDSEERFKIINEAYALLRQRYF